MKSSQEENVVEIEGSQRLTRDPNTPMGIKYLKGQLFFPGITFYPAGDGFIYGEFGDKKIEIEFTDSKHGSVIPLYVIPRTWEDFLGCLEAAQSTRYNADFTLYIKEQSYDIPILELTGSDEFKVVSMKKTAEDFISLYFEMNRLQTPAA